MTLLLALAVAVLFAAGTYMLLQRDLVRDAAGLILIGNAANLFVMASALTRGRAPIHPMPEGAIASDPLAQAMALTALVINFGVSALLLSLVHGVYTTHETIDQDELHRIERREERALERERAA